MPLLALTLSLSVVAAVDEAPLLLREARILDLDTGVAGPPRELLIQDGRIAAIAEQIPIPVGARPIELDGRIVMPGLIDLHSHLLLYPYDQRSWNDQVLRESLELRTIRGVAAARRTVEAGWTTLRELGTEGAGFADVGLRDAVELGIVPGPRILAATRALVATGCYGPSGFDPRWPVPKGAQVADGVDGVRRATREQIAAGADWIKVYADYRRRSGYPATPSYSPAELEAIVAEARSAGLRVSAHATTDEGARRAVLAGVATIEHGYEVSQQTFETMRERGVVLCPTLAAADAIARYTGWDGGAPLHPRVAATRAMMERALAAGVTIACGSDVGVFEHGDNARELKLLEDHGLSRLQVLRAATVVAAEVLQIEGLGVLRVGARADLIALDADPLADLGTLTRPTLVVARGAVVHDRR